VIRRILGGFAGARGIRRGFPLANSAGTYEFARGNPATSRAPATPPPIRREPAETTGFDWHAARRPAAGERARKFRRRERAGLPDAVVACLPTSGSGGAR